MLCYWLKYPIITINWCFIVVFWRFIYINQRDAGGYFIKTSSLFSLKHVLFYYFFYSLSYVIASAFNKNILAFLFRKVKTNLNTYLRRWCCWERNWGDRGVVKLNLCCCCPAECQQPWTAKRTHKYDWEGGWPRLGCRYTTTVNYSSF